MFAPLLKLLLVAQIRGHIAGALPPSHYGPCLPFFAARVPLFTSWQPSNENTYLALQDVG